MERRGSKQREAANATATEQCKSEIATPDLDPIRQKVELYRESTDSSIPFEIAFNDAVPTDTELPVIAKWAALREDCIRRIRQVSKPPATASAIQSAFIEQRQFLDNQAGERIGELVVALHHKKLTYGEFAHKRYDINRKVWTFATAVKGVAVVLPADFAKILDVNSTRNPFFVLTTDGIALSLRSNRDLEHVIKPAGATTFL